MCLFNPRREYALTSLAPPTSNTTTTPPIPPAFDLLPAPGLPGILDWPASWQEHYHAPSPAAGATACTLSHLSILLSAMHNPTPLRHILVLEDDIDAEFSLVSRWNEMKRGLEAREEGWDMVYLGHQDNYEGWKKPVFHPGLRKTHNPYGTQGYALSARGMQRLYHYLSTAPLLFLRPIDHELAWGVMHAAHYNYPAEEGFEFKAWSAVPPLVAGGDGTLGSDIDGGGGYEWGALLGDSTRARIAETEAAERGEVWKGRRTDEEVARLGIVQWGTP